MSQLEDGIAAGLAKLIHKADIARRRLDIKVQAEMLILEDPDRAASYKSISNELTENK